MKKLVMSFIGALMILSLAACTPTTEKNKTGEVKPSSGIADKNPDLFAPTLDVIVVYQVSEDGTKIEGTMDAIDELNPQALLDSLIEYKVLDEGTSLISYEEVGRVDEVGPSVVEIPGVEIDNSMTDQIVLDLSGLPEANRDLVIDAVANTFLENMHAVRLTLKVNGEVVAEDMSLLDLDAPE